MALLWVLVLLVIIFAIVGGAAVNGWLFLLLLIALVLALVGAFEKERQVTFTERLRAAGDLAKRDSREMEVPSYPRNPWTGIHAGRQVLYDLRHPLLFGRRVMAGLRGEIPQISKEQCLVGVALMMFGGVNLLTDIAIVIRSAGWL